jgi:hypothetical protein
MPGHAPQYPEPFTAVTIDNVRLELYRYAEFHDADPRRVESLVTSCDTWVLPEPLVAVSGGDHGLVEWVHDTNEVVLLCHVPPTEAVEAIGTFGPGLVYPLIGATYSGVHYRPEHLDPQTPVAVVGFVGNRASLEWRLRGHDDARRRADGIAWLANRLATDETPASDTD